MNERLITLLLDELDKLRGYLSQKDQVIGKLKQKIENQAETLVNYRERIQILKHEGKAPK